MNIEMLELIRDMAYNYPEAQPNFRALTLIAEQFRKHGLPMRYVGKINEFGEEDAKYIFADIISDFSIIHKF